MVNDGKPGSEPSTDNKAQQILYEIDIVTNVMKDNVAIMMVNHEKADDIREKSDRMRENAKALKRGAGEIHKKMWWQNFKLKIIIGVIILIVIAVIIVPIIVSLT